jgi:pyruvate dehydrogenase E2 component (dihydrolipoyllysine-residue acetyltransferase)
MAVHIAIPKLGMTMNEATIVGWLVGEGEWVEEHQALLEIETEKVSYRVEARASGFVHILVDKDNKVRVNQVVGMLAKSKEELDALQKETPKETYASDTQPREPAPVESSLPQVASTGGRENVRISPVARKMAEEHMIDLTSITGTGPEGRIVKEDVEKAIEAKKAKVTAVEPEVKPGGKPCFEVCDFKRVKSTILLKGMRKTMAEHMLRSLSVAAQLTDMGEIDMTEVVKLRNNLLQKEKAVGGRITFTDIFVLAIARALKDNPIINSSLIGNEIKMWEDINIGVAVATEEDGLDGLIVPVVKNADQKSLPEINKELRALIEKARNGKLMPDDVSGGTFTLTNIGAFGGTLNYSTPIINQPQSAILHTAPIKDRPVAREGQMVVRPIMTYNFTYDHRVIVGASAGRFMSRVAELLEYPSLLLI